MCEGLKATKLVEQLLGHCDASGWAVWGLGKDSFQEVALLPPVILGVRPPMCACQRSRVRDRSVGAGYTVEVAATPAFFLSAFSFVSFLTPHPTPVRQAGLERSPHLTADGTEAQVRLEFRCLECHPFFGGGDKLGRRTEGEIQNLKAVP